MRIAQLAPLDECVPPALYGGTERIVSSLTEELVRRGHRVTLFASGDSQTGARLLPPVDRALRLDPRGGDHVTRQLIEVGMAFDRADEFDVIHSHLGGFALPCARLTGTPTVHTLHGRLDLPGLAALFGCFAGAPLVSISDAQRAPLASVPLAWAATVHHGLALEQWPYEARPDRYLAFLGRLCPEKRPDLAIRVAERVGLPLRIAAKIDRTDRAYFEREIRPLLASPLVEYVGEIGDEEKHRFLGHALALLFPIDWPEPFGLVMIEAMACGTPVIARPCGAVPEVVVDGRTGFLADTVDGLAAAVRRVETLDRRDCRRHVEAHFSVTRMVDAYEAVYRRLAGGARARPSGRAA